MYVSFVDLMGGAVSRISEDSRSLYKLSQTFGYLTYLCYLGQVIFDYFNTDSIG